MNDRALRNIVVGLGAKADGVPREDHFVITVASEIMAILCLADDMDDLKKRLSRIIVAYTRDGEPVTAGQLQAVGAMAALLKDAIKPNLVQTLEHNPVIIHGGPFANIAHGCNSVRATKTALGLSDITVTEAGFGADLGAEKFLDIKCRMGVEFYSKNVEANLGEAAKTLKTTPADLVDHIKKLQEELKNLRSENESLKSKEAQAALGDVMDQVLEIKGVKLLATSVKGVDMNGLRDLGDQMKTKLGEGVVVLISEADGKVNLVTMATDGAMAKGAHAGNLVKAIAPKVGGGGGGRPNMAQAGGKNPAGIQDALAEAKTVLLSQIN